MNVLAIATQAADQAAKYDGDLHLRSATLDVDLYLCPHVSEGRIDARLWVADVALTINAGMHTLDLGGTK